jgi:hypothetical protein
MHYGATACHVALMLVYTSHVLTCDTWCSFTFLLLVPVRVLGAPTLVRLLVVMHCRAAVAAYRWGWSRSRFYIGMGKGIKLRARASDEMEDILIKLAVPIGTDVSTKPTTCCLYGARAQIASTSKVV